MSRDRLLKRSYLIPLLTACILTFFGGVALAANYLGNGYFPWSYIYWQFGGPTSDAGGSYITPARNGMATWTSRTDVDFAEVADGSWDVLVNVGNYGATNWTGYAYICNTAYDCDNSTAWASTFYYCEARINSYYLSSHTQARRQNTMMHEVGHCLSLGHRADSTSLMQDAQTSITTPNSTDVSLVNARY